MTMTKGQLLKAIASQRLTDEVEVIVEDKKWGGIRTPIKVSSPLDRWNGKLRIKIDVA